MSRKKTNAGKNGFVVVVVLCMVVMLGVLLLGFDYECRTRLRVAENSSKCQRALLCAKAGLNIAIAAVANDSVCGNSKLLNLLSGKTAIGIDAGTCSVKISEENGKLNLNRLIDESGNIDWTKTDQLLRLVDVLNQSRNDQVVIDCDLTPSLIDWMDIDEGVTVLAFATCENFGAESGYYEKLDPAYSCRNGQLETAEELLLIKGVSAEVFNRIRDYVTVYGDGKININSAPSEIIECLSKKIDSCLAQMIVDRRQIRAYSSVGQLRTAAPMTDSIFDELSSVITVTPTERYYRVTSVGHAGGHSHNVEAILKRGTKTEEVEVILYREN